MDHGLATQQMLTGYQTRAAAVRYPCLGSLLSKELGNPDSDLPNYVSLSPMRMADGPSVYCWVNGSEIFS